MRAELRPAIVLTVLFTVLTGGLYPLAVTAVARVVFPEQAAGSLVHRQDGSVVGSRLVGQGFTGDRYFHPRPSAAGTDGYDATASGGSNLGAIDKRLIDRISTATAALREENPGKPVPVDLVTTSGSGLDPDITPAAAWFQVPRIARARGLEVAQVGAIVDRLTTDRQWGFFGERRVNVLALNLALDAPAGQ